jgi:hypothetical protein
MECNRLVDASADVDADFVSEGGMGWGGTTVMWDVYNKLLKPV